MYWWCCSRPPRLWSSVVNGVSRKRHASLIIWKQAHWHFTIVSQSFWKVNPSVLRVDVWDDIRSPWYVTLTQRQDMATMIHSNCGHFWFASPCFCLHYSQSKWNKWCSLLFLLQGATVSKLLWLGLNRCGLWVFCRLPSYQWEIFIAGNCFLQLKGNCFCAFHFTLTLVVFYS